MNSSEGTPLSNDEQLRQMAGAQSINTILDALRWNSDGMITPTPSQVLGNVIISYYHPNGKVHKIECEGAKLARWLITQKGQTRLAFLRILDKKISTP